MTTTQMPDRFRGAVAGLTPGYFALVMATGIISVGMDLKGFEVLSLVMLAVCGASFLCLSTLTLWRFLAYRSAVNDDFMDPRRAFGFSPSWQAPMCSESDSGWRAGTG